MYHPSIHPFTKQPPKEEEDKKRRTEKVRNNQLKIKIKQPSPIIRLQQRLAKKYRGNPK